MTLSKTYSSITAMNFANPVTGSPKKPSLSSSLRCHSRLLIFPKRTKTYHYRMTWKRYYICQCLVSTMLSNIYSLSALGLETMQLEIPNARGPQNPTQIHMDIQHCPRHGWPRLCVVISMWTTSRRSRKHYPTMVKKYCAALTNVFEALGEAETKQCEDIASKWNTNDLPDDIRQKCISCNSCTGLLILHTHTDCPKIFQRMSLTF